MNVRQKWLSVVGIGEEGLAGLSTVSRSLLTSAEVLVGGQRHLAMLPPTVCGERVVWSSPLSKSLEQIRNWRGRAVCVLASGDPMCFGIGVTLSRQIPITEMTIIPAPSAFSLACARLGWSLTAVETLSLCGRNPNILKSVIYPHAQVLILSADKQTPAIVAQILRQQGYGKSQISVLEHMGGDRERLVEGIAERWEVTDLADLNTIAVTCIADRGLRPLARWTGLPDSAYAHDGQLTKQEVRAVTMAALAPLPGQLLWDVGAGCGSIGIEWMIRHPRCRAIAIEQNSRRLQYIADNASALGVPSIEIVVGEAPKALEGLPQPDAIFIGGGLTANNLLETCWTALSPGGNLVANAVTVEGEQQLFRWQRDVGGDLRRIAIQRTEAVGRFLGWKAMSPITQLSVVKSCELV